jgi:hypothetical protein
MCRAAVGRFCGAYLSAGNKRQQPPEAAQIAMQMARLPPRTILELRCRLLEKNLQKFYGCRIFHCHYARWQISNRLLCVRATESP